MPRYTVTMIETTHNTVTFEADNLEAARVLAEEGIEVEDFEFKFVSDRDFEDDVREVL